MKRVLVVLMAVALLLVGCSNSSDSGDGSSSTAANSGTNPIKDTPGDVNSTKDMSGVVMEYPPGQNPYFNRMPDVCEFIPESLMKELEMIRKAEEFEGSNSYFKVCDMFGTPAENGATLSIGVGLYAENISSLANPRTKDISQSGIDIGRSYKGIKYTSPGTTTSRAKNCFVAWGTFYGSASISVTSISGAIDDPCTRAVGVARSVVSVLPTRPSQIQSQR